MVILDINKSTIKIKKDGLLFYFSSEFNKQRFFNRVDDFIINETLKLNNKYKVRCNYSLILMLAFYKRIEKRGWRVEYEDGKILNEFNIIFASEFK